MLADIVRVVLPFSARETSTKANMAQLLRIKLHVALVVHLAGAGCATSSSEAPQKVWEAVRQEDAAYVQFTVDGGTAGASSPIALAVIARKHELKQWVYPLIASYLPPGIPLPRKIRLVTAADEIPFEPYEDSIDTSLGASSPEQAWTHLVHRLYGAGLTNLAAGKLTGIPLPLSQMSQQSVRSNADLNRNLLGSLWIEGLSTYVASHGERLAANHRGILSWQQRSLITPNYLDVRDILVLDEDARARWTKLLRLEDSEGIFGRIGANMAARIERARGVDGLISALGLGPEGFYAAFMEEAPGALVSFELAPELPSSPIEEPALPRRVTH
ncbi:MAG: hypothetical protein FJ146_15505 [Deltaproteobacteria bacterium]|nr:hypothetical protein [Deltaproteobacteria bacterium]